MTDVQITVVVTGPTGRSVIESKTLSIDEDVCVQHTLGRIIGDTARLIGEKAWYGRLQPTSAREGGRAEDSSAISKSRGGIAP